MSDMEMPDEKTLENLSEEGYSSRKPKGVLKYFYYAIGLFMAVFHIYFLGYSSLEPWILYYSHLCFGVVLAYFLYPFYRRSNRDRPTLVDLICMLLAASACVYFISEMDTIIYRVGVAPTSLDLFFATALVALILEMTRRTNGWILPAIAIFFIAYALLGKYLPYGFGGHRGYSFGRVFSYIIGMDGILSTPLATCASFVFLFFLFSAFLASTGAGQFFIDIAMAIAGGKRGGPAKVAVIGSALFGTISGNSAANVVASGTFTIPMMIKVGYSPRFASAVEAVASTGGQMTPPVLGAAAFIIAELTGTPYLDVALATVIPALLYFVSIFYMIDLEAFKENLHGYAREELPNARDVLLNRGHLIIPIFVLIFVLVILKASVIKAAIWAIYSTIFCTFLRKDTRLSPERFVAGFADGAKQAVGLIAACATAGIIIGVLNLTGTGLKFASGIIALSGGILPVALVLTMASSLVLGMGLPTAAAYLICAAVVVPALTGLGVPALTGHLFIFYFACLSAITPPVALAAFTAASLGKTRPMRVAITAVRLGIVAFIVPFMFVYAPSLLWQGEITDILVTIATSLCGVFFLGSALQGAFHNRLLNIGQRVLFFAGSLALIQPGMTTDMVGMGLVTTAFIWQRLASRQISGSMQATGENDG